MKNKKGAGLKNLFIGLILTGLFAFALITGGIQLAELNNGANSLADDPAFSTYKTNLTTALQKAHNDTNASIESLGDSPLSAIPGAFIFEAISGVWKTLKVVPVTIYNLTFGLAKDKIFGDSFALVFGVIGAIITLLIIFGVIKLVSSGQDE